MIDKKETEKIANLSRLRLTEAEIVDFSVQLSKAVEFFEHIGDVDTTNVEPLVTPIETELHLREDVVNQEISSEKILANAPQKTGNLFTVPPVV